MTEADYLLLILVLAVWALRETAFLGWRDFRRRRDPFLHDMRDLIDADKRAVDKRKVR